MKKLNRLIILLLILISSKLNAQQLSFDELVLLQKKDLTGINDYLMAKGWDYSHAEKQEDGDKPNWSFKKNSLNNGKAVAWLTTNIINGETYSIQYHSTNKNVYNAIIAKVKEYNMRKIDSGIEDDNIYTKYSGKNYSIKIILKSGQYESVNSYIFFLSKNYSYSDYPLIKPEPQAKVVTVSDFDGNTYKTVIIGNQTWFAENLNTTKYNDGTLIPNITDSTEWSNLTTDAYCNYNNKASNATIYGRLYNWYAVNTDKLCPKGWHVPSDAEWTTLEDYLINNGYNYDGSTTGNKIAKAMASTKRWNSSTSKGNVGNNLLTNNRSGFSALPGCYRSIYGAFYVVGKYGGWWCTTENSSGGAYGRSLGYNYSRMYSNDNYKVSGFSVRCLRN